MNTNELSLADLRIQQRRLSARAVRLSWLRRLVIARTDLEVARLTGVIAEAGELEPMAHVALALTAPPGPELLGLLSASARSLAAATAATQAELDALTGELVGRYAEDPARCLAATADAC